MSLSDVLPVSFQSLGKRGQDRLDAHSRGRLRGWNARLHLRLSDARRWRSSGHGAEISVLLDQAPGRMARRRLQADAPPGRRSRSEENTSELQSLIRLSSAVLCLKKKTT